MKRFFLGLLRFLVSWRLWRWLILAALLVVLLYIEEDWRGARMLADAQARWKAAGFSLDPASYIPPPVPDDQNLAALPEFQWEPDPANPGEKIPRKLDEALDGGARGGLLLNSGPNDDLAANVRAAYAKKFPGQTTPISGVAQLEALCPFIVKLRTAAATRPLFRLNEDYTSKPVWKRSLTLLAAQIRVSRLLSFHAKLALKENEPEVAAQDVHIGLQIARGVGQEPTLVSGLVSIGGVALMRSVVVQGLDSHKWRDEQLAALAKEFLKVDFIANGRRTMASEESAFAQLTISEMENSRSNQSLFISKLSDGDPSRIAIITIYIWPRGWWDSNAAEMLEVMRRAATPLDDVDRRVDSKSLTEVSGEMEARGKAWLGWAPWNVLAVISTGPMTKAPKQFVHGQVADDETGIACALERYWLAHGVYPAKLDALAPTYIDAVPHDVMNGEPYHYRLKADGTFLLYSVGWNQKDDGGTVVHDSSDSPKIDFDQGDWVWPMQTVTKK